MNHDKEEPGAQNKEGGAAANGYSSPSTQLRVKRSTKVRSSPGFDSQIDVYFGPPLECKRITKC